jgi:GxxExxY protein
MGFRMQSYTPLSEADEAVVTDAIGCAVSVHRTLGPGFKESIYHRAFVLELDSRGIRYETEKPILVKYRSWEIPGQRVDLIVGGIVLIEIKAVPKIRALHRAQVLSYLRTTKLHVGLILNFNATLMRHGIQRVAL